MNEPAAETIKTRCLNCDSTLRVKSAVIGKKVKCPKCEQPFVVAEIKDKGVVPENTSAFNADSQQTSNQPSKNDRGNRRIPQENVTSTTNDTSQSKKDGAGAAQAPSADDSWYYTRDGHQSGPVTQAELADAARRGEITGADLIWKQGMTDWIPASSVRGLLPRTASTASPKAFCRMCGTGIGPGAMACLACGVPPGRGNKFCSKCGSSTHPEAIICVKCGTGLVATPSPNSGKLNAAESIATREILEQVISKLPCNRAGKAYFFDVFYKFEKNGGRFETSWNWHAFLFGIFMYLRYGIWLKAIIFLAACILLAGVPAPFFWLYAGIAFNYDLYLQKVKNKALW